jgi:hypothetical protein
MTSDSLCVLILYNVYQTQHTNGMHLIYSITCIHRVVCYVYMHIISLTQTISSNTPPLECISYMFICPYHSLQRLTQTQRNYQTQPPLEHRSYSLHALHMSHIYTSCTHTHIHIHLYVSSATIAI